MIVEILVVGGFVLLTDAISKHQLNKKDEDDKNNNHDSSPDYESPITRSSEYTTFP